MNSRKRQAQPLLPTRSPKQPRLALKGYAGGAPSPSEPEGISSRWLRAAKEFAVLVSDTIEAVAPAISMKKRMEKNDSDTDTSADDLDSPINESSTMSCSTPRQPSLSNQHHVSSSKAMVLSPPPFVVTPIARNTLTSNGREPAIRPENIPLPLSPTDLSMNQDHRTSPTPIPITFHRNQSTPKNNPTTSFTTATPTISPSRIPAEQSHTSHSDSILRNNIVPSMRSLNIQAPPTALSQASKPPSNFSSESQGVVGSQASRRSSHSSARDPLRRNPRKREHIYSKVHKASIQRQNMELREEITRELFEIKRKTGFSSGFKDFKGLLNYQRKLQNIDLENTPPMLHSSTLITGFKPLPRGRQRIHEAEDDDTQFLQRALDNAKATLNSPKPPKPFVPTLEQLQISHRAKDEDIERRLRPPVPSLPTFLPPNDENNVKEILRKRGVVSKYAREQVSNTDLSRLMPAQWLNDEIINFYGAMLLGRSESSKENPAAVAAKGKKAPLNIHYFSSFFWSKLASEGYEKGRLAKWTKKMDLFSKDIVLMPVNHGNAHWTAAAINFRQKRFESHDSMGMAKTHVTKKLREYIREEHLNKKKKEFNFTGWEDWAPDSTPQQENGYDCGVFTCQFMEALSRGDEFNFSQKDMPYLRRRMIWEIGNAKLRDDR